MSENQFENMSPSRTGKPPGSHKRRIKNLLLQPQIQIKFAIYSLLLSVSLVAVLSFVVYHRVAEFTEILLELTGAREEVLELMEEYYTDLRISAFTVFLIFLGITMGTYVRISHRLLGPAIAFKHHIKALIKGQYEHRTFLRQKDAFKELADDLNKLSETLESKYGQKD